jgi:hypothetical protein
MESGSKTREQILLDLPFSPNDITTLAGLPEGYFREGFGELKLFPSVKPKETAQDSSGVIVPFSRGGSS